MSHTLVGQAKYSENDEILYYPLKMPLRRISSLLTFSSKFVLPTLFVIGSLNVMILGPSSRSVNDETPIGLFYLISIVFGALAVWNGWRLKWVAIDEKNQRLYVSNYRKEVMIPFSEIEDAAEFFFSDPRRITIRLRNPTEFGQKIVFLATYRFGGWLSGPHPIVNELRQLRNS